MHRVANRRGEVPRIASLACSALLGCHVLLGCNVVLGLDERSPRASGGGGATSASGGGATNVGGSGGAGGGTAGGQSFAPDPWLVVVSTVGDAPTRTRGVTVDSAQNVYAVGEYEGTADLAGESATSMGADDAFILKLSGEGVGLWSETIGGPQGQRFWDVVETPDGVVTSLLFGGDTTIGGQQVTPASGTDSAVVAYSPAGTYQRHTLLTSTQSWSARNLTTTTTGISVVGVFRGSSLVGTPVNASELDAMIVDFDDQLAVTDTHVLNAAGMDANIIDVAARGASRYAAGWIDDAGAESMSISARGGDLWQVNFDGPSLDLINEIEDDGTQLLVAGVFYSTLDIGQQLTAASPDGNGVLIALNYDGGVAWHQQQATTAASSLHCVRADVDGTILIAGVAFGEIDLGGGPLVPDGTHNVFVARLSNSGSHIASTMLGGTGMQFVDAIAPAHLGGVVVAGRFFGEMRVGADMFTGSVTEGVGYVARVLLD